MTLPGGQDEVVTWLAEFRAEVALEELRRLEAQGKKTSTAMGGVQKSTQQTEQAMNKGGRTAKEYARGIDAVRIALGAIVAMAVFRTIQFIEDSMRKAIETAKEYETSLYRLVNVERILSKTGTEISMKGLKKGIQEVKDELPIFSEADITQQISLIGIMTKEWGLTERQIIDTAKAIGVLNIRSAETEDLLTTTNKVLTALVAPSGRGIASLGLDFSEAALKAEALKTGILKAGEAFSDLTDHEKDMLKLAILMENTGSELETVKEFLETNTGALAEQNAEWEDTLRIAGQALLGLQAAAAPFITDFLKFLQDAINGAKALLVIFQAVENAFYVFAAALASFFQNPVEFIKNFDGIKDAMGKAFEEGLRDGFKKFFSGEIPADAPQWFKDIFEDYVENADEATAATEALGDAIQDVGELKGFDDLARDLEDFQVKIDKVNEDFDIKMRRMLEDFNIDQRRMAIDYQRKREDIIRDFNNKIAKANEEYRRKEEDEEAKFQERLRQLREKYLLNLEDALRERDARQVLRLQQEYQMNKQNLINEHALRTKDSDEQHQQDIQDLAKQRDDRLRELEEEYRIKRQRAQEDYNLKKQREQLDHQRDLEDIRRRINDRLMEFARAIGEEYNLNEQGVKNLYELLQQYYGPNGVFDGLYRYSYDSVIARSKAMLSAINQIISGAVQATQTAISYLSKATSGIGSQIYGSVVNKVSPTGIRGSTGKIPQLGFARGGMMLATQPTRATFGEVEPELVTAIPLSKIGRGGVNNIGGMAGMGGELQLAILLSSDLEARIVKTSLENVSAVIESVGREA